MKIAAITAMALCAALALSSCQRQVDNGPTELSGRIFVFNYRVSIATYVVTLRKKAPIPDGSYAVAEFENPMGGDPLVVKEKIFPFWDKITLQSPAIHCVRKDRPYSVSISLVDADGKTIQSIKTSVTSDVDQTMLAAKPLIIGPFYNRNPEVFKPDGSADFSPETGCPVS
jgi:hypothetical protein